MRHPLFPIPVHPTAAVHRFIPLLALILLLSGQARAQSLDLVNRKGRTTNLTAGPKARYAVVLMDSAVADSTWPGLLRATDQESFHGLSGTDYWWLDSLDLATERLAFRPFEQDTTTIWIPIQDIHGMIPKPGFGGAVVTNGVAILSPVFFFLGAFGIVWGLGGLIDQGTTVEEDLRTLGGALGSFAFFAAFVSAGKAWQKGHLYRIRPRP
jgi:hypothetical protein